MNYEDEEVKDFLISLNSLKQIDLEKPSGEDFNLLQKFYSIKYTDSLIMNINRCSLAVQDLIGSGKFFEQFNIAILTVMNDLMGEDMTFNCLSIFALLKKKVEPNYAIIPKIINTKPKPNVYMDLVFGRHQSTFKAIHLVEYIRQKDLSLEQFINLSIRVKVIDWLELVEVKTPNWYMNFLENIPENYIENIDEILSMFSEES